MRKQDFENKDKSEVEGSKQAKIEVCQDCPRHCRINNPQFVGFCGKDSSHVRIAKVMRHMWEEPVIVGETGSGAIFFSHCSLKCKFCQNYEISHLGRGKDFDVMGLAKLIKKVDESGAENINFVTPTHYTSKIVEALKIYKPKVPIVWNTSGYECNLQRIEGIVDIFLFDFKYFDSNLSAKFSSARDYFDVCMRALKTAREIVKEDIIENGVMKKGIIIRHLVLPNCAEDSTRIFEEIKKELGTNVIISLMSQFVPCYKAKDDPSLNRQVTPLEYKKVLMAIKKLGFERGYVQESSSAKCDYTPDFSKEKFFEL